MVWVQSSFSSITSTEELRLRLISFFTKQFFSEFYVCLFDEKQIVEDPNEFLFPDKMNLFFGYNRGEIYSDMYFEVKDLLPQYVKRKTSSKTFLIFPIVFNDISYGYIMCDVETAENMSFVAIKDMLNNTLFQIDSFNQIQAYSKQMENLSLTDSLTGLKNRRGFEANTEDKFNELVKKGKRPGVLYCDVDRLKYINDTFGHAEGDFIIKQTAKVLNRFFFHDEVIARIGGDEFIVFIDDVDNLTMQQILDDIEEFTSEINKKINKPYEYKLSFGISSYSSQSKDILGKIIKEADQKLYQRRKIRRKLNV
jgi:diguanylate cyclase (GGDEF)-like protein